MALDDGGRSTKADANIAGRTASDVKKDSTGSPDTESRPSRAGSSIAYAVFIIVPLAIVLLLVTNLILAGNWWRISIVAGMAFGAAILGRHFGMNLLESIPLWATVAILTWLAFSIYDDFAERKNKRRVSLLECSSVSCAAQTADFIGWRMVESREAM